MAAAISNPLAAKQRAASIDIPTQRENEFIEVFLNELPADAEEIVEILRSERAPLNIWRMFATEYYHRGLVNETERILKTAIEQNYAYKDAQRDRVGVLDALAAYHVARGVDEQDAARQSEHFTKAAMSINASEDIDSRGINTWLVKALLLLTRGDLTRASTQFSSVLATSPDNVPALLGMACIEFNNEDFVAALQLFKKALRVLPENTPMLRLGIGLCYHQLNKEHKARLAYQRCLEMEPRNVQALVGLGMLDMNSSDPDRISQGLQTLRKAYDIDRTHPLVLNQLANHFLCKHAYDKVENLAKNAYFSSKVEVVQAESCLILAHAYHAKEDYENAFNFYFQAAKLSPSLTLAQFGLGQMFLYRGETEQAVGYFESVLKDNPNNYESRKILGSLYGQMPGKRTEAIEYLRKVVQMKPEDVEAWIELAEYLEGTNLQESLKAYEMAVKLLNETGEATIPPDIQNNIGALCHKLGRLSDAHRYYEQAFIDCQTLLNNGGDASNFKGLLLTMKYNRARLLEDQHLVEEAGQLYKEIILDEPHYIDAHLRLGIIAINQRDNVTANDYFKEALAIAPGHPDIVTLTAQSHLLFSELIPASKDLERLLSSKPIYTQMPLSTATQAPPTTGSGASSTASSNQTTFGGSHDSYGMVALGNVYHRMCKREHNLKKQLELQKMAFEVYMKALYFNQRNAFAANGIAVLLAERGHFAAAKEIFLQVRDVAPDNVDVWLNLAHVNYEMGLYADAIKIYESALKKLQNNQDVATLLYLARALFHQSKRNKDHTSTQHALRYLERALHIRPWDMSIMFNLALVQQELASLVAAIPPQRRTMDQVADAQHAVQQSIKLFSFLAKATPYPSKSYERQMARQRADFSEALVPWLEKQRTQQHQAETKRKELLETLDAQKRLQESEEQAELCKLREEEMRKEDTARRMAEQLREEVQRKMAETRQAQAERVERATNREPGRPRGRPPKERSADDDNDEEDGRKRRRIQEPRLSEREKGKKRVVARDAETSDDDDDDEGADVPRREAAPRTTTPTAGRGRLKKRVARQMDDEIDSADEDDAVSSLVANGGKSVGDDNSSDDDQGLGVVAEDS